MKTEIRQPSSCYACEDGTFSTHFDVTVGLQSFLSYIFCTIIVWLTYKL